MKLFDAHFHIIPPSYPLLENNNFLPEEFTIEDYHGQLEGIELIGGTVVSGSFQGYDTTYLTATLDQLNSNYYGVANIRPTITDPEIRELSKAGVVGVRFNLKRSGSEVINHMPYLSQKLFKEYGWHTELYLDSNDMKELSSTLTQLPKFSVDHLGLSESGLNELYKWVEKGSRVKASGFGRLDFDPLPVMQKIYAINPKALLFGTDLPSTRAPRPFEVEDIQLIAKNFSAEAQERIFHKNAKSWYGK